MSSRPNRERVVGFIRHDDRGHPGRRGARDLRKHLRELGRIAVGKRDGDRHLPLVFQAVWRRIGGHHNRRRIDHRVEQGVRHQHRVQRLLERNAVQIDRDLAILECRVVGDVDARRASDGVQDVADTGLRELEPDRLARSGIQQRLGRHLPRLLPEIHDGRSRPGSLDPIANRTLELRHLFRRLTVCGIELDGPFVFEQRPIQLVPGLELPGRVEVGVRRVQHRAFEGNAEFGLVGIGLDGLAVIGHCRVPVPDPRPIFSASKRETRGASADHDKCAQERGGAYQSSHVSGLLACLSDGLTAPPIEIGKVN